MTQTVRDELRLEYFNKFGDETNEKMHEQFDWFITKMEEREEKLNKQTDMNLAKLLAQFNGMLMEDGVKDKNGEPVMFYPPKLEDLSKFNKLKDNDD